VVDGIDKLSTLPRGTEALGFYKDKSQYAPIVSIRIASDVPAQDRPSYEVMDTNSPSFARYLKLRANRHDAFYEQPAGGVDLCNVSVPVRKRVAEAR
jgi:peptidylprolyl isomerase